MTGVDVGGSNTGNQTGYRSYGMDGQNQTRMEGIDTTEGTAANAGWISAMVSVFWMVRWLHNDGRRSLDGGG